MSFETDFINYLRTITQAPGPTARLRRTLAKTPAEATQAHAIVGPFVSDKTHSELEAALYTTAALYATYADPTKEPAPNGSVGEWLGSQVADTAVGAGSVERRLYHLARLDGPAMRYHLPRLINAAHRAAAPEIAWAQLLIDLRWWQSNPQIAKTWIQRYHRAATPITQEPNEDTSTNDPAEEAA